MPKINGGWVRATGALAVTALSLSAWTAHGEDRGSSDPPATGFSHLKQTAQHDSRVAAAAIKDGAHRVAVAAKAVGHEIAMASKRGAAETRAAFKGEKR